jgi:hypothetical protein
VVFLGADATVEVVRRWQARRSAARGGPDPDGGDGGDGPGPAASPDGGERVVGDGGDGSVVAEEPAVPVPTAG